MVDCLSVLDELEGLLHFLLLLLVELLFISLEHFLNPVQRQENLVPLLLQLFQAGHDLKQLVDILRDRFVSNLYSLLCPVEEV